MKLNILDMTTQERNQIKSLIPDLQPMDHVSLNTKRINFIYGHGVIVYDDHYAVEIYMPKTPHEKMTFFAVDRHFGKTNKLGEYYRRMPVLKFNDPRVTPEIRSQYDEALFMNIVQNDNVKDMYDLTEMKRVA